MSNLISVPHHNDCLFCCSVIKSCLTLCQPMDCNTPGFPDVHHLPEFAQTHVQWINDAIQPSYPLSPPSPYALNLSHHQGLLVSSSHQVAKVLELQLQHQSFQWILSWFPLGLTGLISMQSKGLKNFLQHHNLKPSVLWLSACFIIQLSHPHKTTGKTIALTRWT